MIAVIDYGMGNLRSVAKALERSGARKVLVSSDCRMIDKADKLVLPGVGAMREAMAELRKRRLIDVIKEGVLKKPFLGICLGLQLLFSQSQEGGRVKGLGVFAGEVRRFPARLKVPHMGWNQIKVKSQKSKVKIASQIVNLVLKGIPDKSFFYFCHSYYVAPEDKGLIAATTGYGIEFVSAIARDNLFACQFHPEKSQELGLRMLKNFVRL